jgi:2-C-methyl-D-erythritol 4-phosphate cytidylyltransferase/2-C-methyl-D-erythritol 2,4-cyclodiphosphate synthase
MDFSAVVVAAGSGTRAGAGQSKQWRDLAGRPVVRWSVEALLQAGAREVVVVIAADAESLARAALEGLPRWRWAVGGETRSRSVRNGLAALACGPDEIVLVHDAARPLLSQAAIRRLLDALETRPAAILALPLADTLKRAGDRDAIVETPSRVGLWRAQTPQGFRLGALQRAFAAWPADQEPTDEAAVAERAGGEVALVVGDPALAKLTFPEDFAMAEQLAGAARVTRIGQGFDAHRFGPGDKVTLCGVEIGHDHGLIGHSDADAGLHARRPFPTQRSAMEGRRLGSLPGPCPRPGERARRAGHQRRCDPGLRAAQDQTAPRRHAPAPGRDPADRPERGEREGHHHRADGFHRPRGGSGRPGGGGG